MVKHAEQHKGEIVEKVATLVRERLEAPRAEAAEAFVRRFYEGVPPDDIRDESSENLYGAALSLWNFGRARKAGEAKVRVFNPRMEEQGWQSSHTVIEIINDDMPFLVDSVTAELTRLETSLVLVIHPIIEVQRDEEGTRIALGSSNGAGARESFMHVEIAEQPSTRHEEIERNLARILADVRVAVLDWREMGGRLRSLLEELEQTPPPLPAEEIEEGLAFLRWLDDDHFTYLGYREYSFEGEGDAAIARIHSERSLGLLRDESFSVFDGLRNLGTLPPDVQDFVRAPELLRLTKSNRRSTVHRAVYMETVVVKRFDAKGQVLGERLFLGLFTSVAYSRSPREIPLLRQKVDKVIRRAGFLPESHDGKALQHILDTFPRDELFQITVDELYAIATGILHLQERRRTALFVRSDPFERFVSCLVYVPRDRYDTDLRLKFQDILAKAYDGEVTASFTQMSDEALARLHVLVKTTQGKVPAVDLQAVEHELAEAGRSWTDHLEDALVEAKGEERGIAAARRYARAFPASYQDQFSAGGAVFDIDRIEEALERNRLAMNLYRPLEAGEEQIHFKIYNAGGPVPLSDVLPMLENMGLKVISEMPFEIRPHGAERHVWIHDFNAVSADGHEIKLKQVKEPFHEAFAKIWSGEMEDDGFNRLVLGAGLRAREVTVLRAYSKFLRQAAVPFSQDYMEETLACNPEIARLLVELFLARFDPAAAGEAAAAEERLVAAVEEGLEQVANLDQDRIFRQFLSAIRATLRTNYFQNDGEPEAQPKGYLSLKFDSRALEELPQPRPLREIFVYAARVEGVHLRFGLVARGGLRWSDRREDFRTEILGLVKAQQVKNAVIVPVGSKGGFVVKHPPPLEAGREAIQAEGIECYKTFIRGLLDLTDNLVDGQVVPPQDVVRHDGDDPYLVVAADKGTATFSDIANGVSGEYDFWLGDAFASGGSAGYDHKAMGITARGAWESVKRHFRELGKNIQEQDFTCIGVGDMSGDVFGNGMLLSRHIRLIAAFNHLHIFIDPDPSPEISYAERERLFKLPRSSWSDYDSALISKGGGVFDRKAKSLSLSPEIKSLLGLSEASVTPNVLIQAILKAEAELLWFGGIGTYVKARDESHLEVGDRGNDALRINAAELRAKVVGEGANLGMTQRARIEFALRGGHLNTDSIDNSAGVDCSDHEVNIKILLREVEAGGDMTRKQRDQLLERMTEDVAELVLRDNYLQTQAISITGTMTHHLLDRLARHMRTMEKRGLLSRQIEFLPDDETIEERMKRDLGLTRPELAVLLSYAKIALYDEILESDVPDDPYMTEDLKLYFPEALREDFSRQIEAHRLRREIIATSVTNSMINRVGISFTHEVTEKTGMPSGEIARAYTVAREIFRMRDLWRAIEALDNRAPAATQYSMLVECGRLIEYGVVWLLRHESKPIDISAALNSYREGVDVLRAKLLDVLPGEDHESLWGRAASLGREGVPEDLAQDIAALPLLVPACDIVISAERAGLSIEEVARTYFLVGGRFGFDWLRRAAGRLPSDNAWDKLAVTAIVDDLYEHQTELTNRVLANGEAGSESAERVEIWTQDRRTLVTRTEQLLTELQAAGTPDLAMLAVANRRLKSMVGG